MIHYEWAICRGCGKKILWGKTADGKTVPLDPTPAIYQVVPKEPGVTLELKAVRVTAARPDETVFTGFVEGMAVSHFATCPKADEFGAGRKKG